METIYDVLTAIEKVGSVTDIPLEEDKGAPFNINADEGISIQTKNLSFQFADAKDKVVDNLNFGVKSGEHLCVAGSSGSGKSFLLQLISGLFDSYQGSISFNRMPISSFCREDLRSYIGDSLSKEDIFKGTIIENITLGKPNISMEQIQEVVTVLGLSDFVASTDYGYATVLMPEGKNLPKSVRMKIMLARSIVGNPRLVLLEDSFNYLAKNDRQNFMNYLLDRKHNWTVIAISNEEEVAAQFDKVLVLDKGGVIANDDASVRLANSGYQEEITNELISANGQDYYAEGTIEYKSGNEVLAVVNFETNSNENASLTQNGISTEFDHTNY